MNDIGRLLDGLPWWALLGLAALTFLFLHRLATAGGGPAYGAAAGEPTASQLILIILAGAGQYLFPALLLVEAAGVAIASRRARSSAPGMAAAVAAGFAPFDALGEQAGGREERPEQAQSGWSLPFLNRLEAHRFAALAMAYYRERGMRCDLIPSGADGAIILRLFQEGLGRPPVLVQFRAQGAAWIGAKQIGALRAVMAREGVEKGLFMTPGAFSKDAKVSARAHGVTLIDGMLFLMMIGRLGPAARERLLNFVVQVEHGGSGERRLPRAQN